MKNFTWILFVFFIFQTNIGISQTVDQPNSTENKLNLHGRIYSVTIDHLKNATLEVLKKNILEQKYFTFLDYCESKNSLLIEISSEAPMRTAQIESVITDKILKSIPKTEVTLKYLVDKNDFQKNCIKQ